MRRIILTLLAVMLGITYGYAESCSCGQGCLSYQISGCSEQKRACCSGTWCSWGTSSCASCTATTQACSGNVTNACAGNRTRSVTGSCGSSCTYGSWSNSGCSYTQSCTATSESRNCSGNVSGACAGTQTRTRTVKSTCGSCSYNSWGSWSTSGCSYTQSCTATSESRNCSGNVSNACAGTQTRTRTVKSTCGSCSYNSWGSWSTSGCSYTQSCTATSESRNCSGNVSGACAGTQTRTRTVKSTCGSCSYNSWGSWSTSGCSYTQSCTATSESRNCSGNVSGACAGTQTRTRTVKSTCGSCSYNSWGSWTGTCTYTQSCTATSQACSGNVSGACAGTRTRSVTGTCGSCSYSGWSNSGCSYTQSCTATSESRNCSGNVSNACAGTQTRTRTVKSTCGSCSYNSWGSWSTSGCSYTQSCTATSESRNCSGNVSGACAGTQTRTRTVKSTCGSCSYNSWGSWTTSGGITGCLYTQSCTETSKTESCTVNGKSSAKCYELYPTGNFAGSGVYKQKCTRSVSSNCGTCTYGSWSCGGSCALEESCYNPLTSGGCQYHELWVLSTRYSTLSACRSAWTYYDDLYDDAGVWGGMAELDGLVGGGDVEGMTCNSFNSNHYFYYINDCVHIYTDSQGSIIGKDTSNHYYNIYDYNTADSISEGYYLLGVVTGCVCNTGLSYGDKYYIPPNVLRAPFNNGIHSGVVTN